MGKILSALALPEPKRTKALNGELDRKDPDYEKCNLGGQKPFDVVSSVSFRVKFLGEVIEVKKGRNSFNRNFAVYLCNKYNGKTPIGAGRDKKKDFPIVVDAPDEPEKPEVPEKG